jgi:hypothetical protein
MTSHPTVHYWHLWRDGEGTSHQTRCPIEQFELKSIQPTADPQWLGKKSSGEMTMMVAVLPGSFLFRDAGSWRRWTEPGSRWGPVSYLSEPTRIVGKKMASEATDPERSETRRPS